MGKHTKKKSKNKFFKKIWKYRRLIILIWIIVLTICLLILIFGDKDNNDINNSSANLNLYYENEIAESDDEEEEKIIDTISGQTAVQDGDGYTTTFSTTTKEYIEYKQILGSWAENSYWGGTMAENGCGITSIAIIASGYGLDVTPEDLREEYYPHLDAEDIESAINKLGIECTEFYFSSLYINEEYISEWLETDRPILVCLDSSLENMWTAASHYMVLLDVDEDGNIYVSNPNGEEGSEKESNWYSPDEVLPYIAKALFIESY